LKEDENIENNFQFEIIVSNKKIIIKSCFEFVEGHNGNWGGGERNNNKKKLRTKTLRGIKWYRWRIVSTTRVSCIGFRKD